MGNLKTTIGAVEAYETAHHLHTAELWYGDGGGSTLASNLTEIQTTAGTGGALSVGEQVSDGTEIEGGSATKKNGCS